VFEREVRSLLRGLGLSEIVTSSLESSEAHDRLGLPVDDPRRNAVMISNWKTADRTQLRTTLMTTTLEVLALNRRQGVEDVAVFDLGRVYLPAGPSQLPEQPQRLALAVTGRMAKSRWMKHGGKQWDFFALKGVVENMLEALLGRPGEFVAEQEAWFRFGHAAQVSLNGVRIGMVGELSYGARAGYDLPNPVFVAEFYLETMRKQCAPDPVFQQLSRFPAVTRDVAFLVGRETTAEQAGEVIQQAAGGYVESVELFDAFEGKQLPEGKRNLAYSLIFRRADRTLTDEEIDATMEQVRAALREQVKAQIRE
jgi:phenylalanyl-tRNA synthetase beta chain